MSPVQRLALAAWAVAAGLAAAFPSLADRNASAPVAVAAKAAAPATFKLVPGSAAATTRLEAVDEGEISRVKRENAGSFRKKVQIGIGRPVAQALVAHGSASWVAVPGGGYAARWEIVSPGAEGLRVELAATGSAPGAEVRFAGSAQPDTVYGPYPADDFAVAAESRWSPVLEGEGAIIEVHVSSLPPGEPPFAVLQVSHLFVGPWQANAESLAKASQSCEVDFICLAATDAALAQAGKAVAKMTFSDGTGGGGSYLCTGTLLNPTGGSGIPYFYSANHCISTQASASTLATHWFYDRTGCGSGSTSPGYVQVAGGATLLYANETSDGLLLRLSNSPPAGAILSGWDSATVSPGAAATGVHHPAGDWKKVSLATIGGFGSPGGSGSDFIISNWNSTATGVTEGGSSGSGLFTFNGSEYAFRGGLYGGPSSCTAPPSNLYDYYSRFDQVYPSIAQYLDPGTCSYTLTPSSVSLPAGAASGTFGVGAPAGCSWSALSNAAWLSSSSSGSGNGTVTYSVAANSGVARTAVITVGGAAFTVTQQAPVASGTNLLANPGFEAGTASWTQSTTSGYPILYEDASSAHSGSWYAWLAGYNNGLDTLYQVVTLPSGGTTSLRFWYRIQTNETSTTTAYDTLRVTINHASTGALMATLATYSNLDATGAWVQSPAHDVSAFAGQTVRLVFQAQTDFSQVTNFFVDDISLVWAGAPRRGDFDGDARSDVLWRNATASLVYQWGMNGLAIATQGYLPGVTGNWSIAALGDASGDARADVFWRELGGFNYLWMLNGLTVTGQGYLPSVPAPWAVVGMGDADGDGRADVFWRNASSGDNYLWLMNGLAIAAQGYLPNVPGPDWEVAAIADHSGDGKADVLWRNKTTGSVYLWIMNGLAIASQGYLPTVTPVDWEIVGAPDANGDGRADVLWRNKVTGQNYLWLMDGFAITSQGYLPTVADIGWKVVGFGDYDGDGKGDVLWRNAGAGGLNYLWQLNGLAISAQGYLPAVSDASWQPVK